MKSLLKLVLKKTSAIMIAAILLLTLFSSCIVASAAGTEWTDSNTSGPLSSAVMKITKADGTVIEKSGYNIDSACSTAGSGGTVTIPAGIWYVDSIQVTYGSIPVTIEGATNNANDTMIVARTGQGGDNKTSQYGFMGTLYNDYVNKAKANNSKAILRIGAGDTTVRNLTLDGGTFGNTSVSVKYKDSSGCEKTSGSPDFVVLRCNGNSDKSKPTNILLDNIVVNGLSSKTNIQVGTSSTYANVTARKSVVSTNGSTFYASVDKSNGSTFTTVDTWIDGFVLGNADLGPGYYSVSFGGQIGQITIISAVDFYNDNSGQLSGMKSQLMQGASEGKTVVEEMTADLCDSTVSLYGYNCEQKFDLLCRFREALETLSGDTGVKADECLAKLNAVTNCHNYKDGICSVCGAVQQTALIEDEEKIAQSEIETVNNSGKETESNQEEVKEEIKNTLTNAAVSNFDGSGIEGVIAEKTVEEKIKEKLTEESEKIADETDKDSAKAAVNKGEFSQQMVVEYSSAQVVDDVPKDEFESVLRVKKMKFEVTPKVVVVYKNNSGESKKLETTVSNDDIKASGKPLKFRLPVQAKDKIPTGTPAYVYHYLADGKETLGLYAVECDQAGNQFIEAESWSFSPMEYEIILPEDNIPADTTLIKFNTANPVLSQSLSMCYYATISSDITAGGVNAKFEIPNASTNSVDVVTVEGEYQQSGTNAGRYKFECGGINPQRMGDIIKITAYAKDKDGKIYTRSYDNYSFKKYCQNRLNKSTDTVEKQLIADLLAYGEAAQKYIGYDTANLVTKGIDYNGAAPSATPSEITLSNPLDYSGTDGVFSWKSVGLSLSNSVAARVEFIAADVSDTTVTLSVMNGDKVLRSIEVKSFDTVDAAANRYSVQIAGIMPTEYDLKLVFTAKNSSGEQVGVLEYSVNAYISDHTGDGNALANLVNALYNYGASAFAYKNK